MITCFSSSNRVAAISKRTQIYTYLIKDNGTLLSLPNPHFRYRFCARENLDKRNSFWECWSDHSLNPTREYQIREGRWFPFPLKPVMEELVEEISTRIPYILIRLIWL